MVATVIMFVTNLRMYRIGQEPAKMPSCDKSVVWVVEQQVFVVLFQADIVEYSDLVNSCDYFYVDFEIETLPLCWT